MNPNWPIVIYPEVAAAALKHKLHSAYAVFVVVKMYDARHNGSGLIPLSLLVQITQKTLGISKSQAYRVISSGNNIFWRSSKKKIIGLLSHMRAYSRLGVEMFASKPVRMTIAQLGYGSKHYSGSYIKDLMVCTVASWDNGGSGITVDTISELTGVSSRTVQRQIKYMHHSTDEISLCVAPSYRLKCDDMNQIKAKHQVQKLNTDGCVKYHTEPKDGQYAIFERIGNVYIINGVERLGRRKRHIQLKQVSKQKAGHIHV